MQILYIKIEQIVFYLSFIIFYRLDIVFDSKISHDSI